MSALQIPNAFERALVQMADVVTTPFGWGGAPPAAPIRRVLLLRLERIGDLLMVADAILDARTAWPDATIDLAVGTWNTDVAALLPGVNRVLTLNAPWLVRGDAAARWPEVLRVARSWQAHRYDLVINFEPDIRSNTIAWLTGAPRRLGYWTGGGGRLLTDALAYDSSAHVRTNARALVARAARLTDGIAEPETGETRFRLNPPEAARHRAAALLGAARRPLIGLHGSGGRASKQWHVDRFAASAREIVTQTGGSLVLTGSDADRAIVDEIKTQLGDVPLVDVVGAVDLLTLAAIIAACDVFVTGDTGPMHLAAAVGTPIVALFGPSNPGRYGPLSDRVRVLRVSLPCSPCGLVRQPPARCRGHVPDCLDGITVRAVVDAAADLLSSAPGMRAVP